VEGVICNIKTVYLPLAPVRKLFRNHVTEDAPADLKNVIATFINSYNLNQLAPHLNTPEQSAMCSDQEGDVGESYPENWVDGSCSEKGVDDAYLERGVDGAYSEIYVGDSCTEGGFSESEVGDTCSEGGLSEVQFDDSYSESGLSDAYSYTGDEDSQTESQFNHHLPVTSYSPILTRSKSRCLLHSATHMTRSQTKKMREGRSPSCRCESCSETKEMLGKKDWKVHKDSDRSFSVSEMVRERCRSGRSSREIPRAKGRRRSRSLSLNRNTRKHRSVRKTFSRAEIGVSSYSTCSSYSERALSDTCSVMDLSDTYSEIRYDYSQYSSFVSYTRSRPVLNSNTYLTRSLAKKMLGKNDGKVNEDCNSSFSLSEEVRGRQSGSSSRGIQHRRGRRRRRRTRSLSLNRKTRKQNSDQNTFSPAEIGVPSYSECGSYSEGGLSDSCSLMGLSDAYSEVGDDDSQMEGQYDRHLPVTLNSSVVTRSRSRCVLNSNMRLTRSQTKKMQEDGFPSCRCETCKKTKEVLEKEKWKVRTVSKVKLNRSVPHGEAVSRGRRGSVASCGSVQGGRRSRRRNWGRSTVMHHSIQNSDRSLAVMEQFRARMRVRNESGMKRGYVTEKINYMNYVNNSQNEVVYNSDIGVSGGTGIDYSLRVREIYSVPNKRRMEEVQHSYRMHATEMVSGSLAD
jgi:hypothetical protein